ncbi:hypothetical protein HYU12_00310 [Candidatus Woesearchaeota archaeon]|nr:hypothetical protein [Candidatus Woesearchaeota archaeon]
MDKSRIKTANNNLLKRAEERAKMCNTDVSKWIKGDKLYEEQFGQPNQQPENKPKPPNMLRSKKGQFYIFAAIVLITFAFMIAKPAPKLQEKPDAFKELYQNFITESSIVVNTALYDNANVSDRYRSFADSYSQYATTKSPKFRFAYILKDDNTLVIGNRLGEELNVTLSNTSQTLGDKKELTTSPQKATLYIEGTKYEFTMGQETYQAKTLFRQKTDTETRIYVVK